MSLLEALPDDLTHRILGFLQVKRDNAQRFLGIVHRAQKTADDLLESIPDDHYERYDTSHIEMFSSSATALSEGLRDLQRDTAGGPAEVHLVGEISRGAASLIGATRRLV